MRVRVRASAWRRLDGLAPGAALMAGWLRFSESRSWTSEIPWWDPRRDVPALLLYFSLFFQRRKHRHIVTGNDCQGCQCLGVRDDGQRHRHASSHRHGRDNAGDDDVTIEADHRHALSSIKTAETTKRDDVTIDPDFPVLRADNAPLGTGSGVRLAAFEPEPECRPVLARTEAVTDVP